MRMGKFAFPSSDSVVATTEDRPGSHRWLVLPLAILAWALVLAIAAPLL